VWLCLTAADEQALREQAERDRAQFERQRDNLRNLLRRNEEADAGLERLLILREEQRRREPLEGELRRQRAMDRERARRTLELAEQGIAVNCKNLRKLLATAIELSASVTVDACLYMPHCINRDPLAQARQRNTGL
jgi:hypothetical protein